MIRHFWGPALVAVTVFLVLACLPARPLTALLWAIFAAVLLILERRAGL
jgi:hypothetical protein